MGDGWIINIWDNEWLLTPMTYKVTTPRRFLQVDATVKDLIDQDTKWWDVQKIHYTFQPHEAEALRCRVMC